MERWPIITTPSKSKIKINKSALASSYRQLHDPYCPNNSQPANTAAKKEKSRKEYMKRKIVT